MGHEFELNEEKLGDEFYKKIMNMNLDMSK